jgi:hypothetical protein
MPALLYPAVRSLVVSLSLVTTAAPLLAADEPAGPLLPPAVPARAYLESLEVEFTFNKAGDVVAALVHCTSDANDDDMALLRHFPKLEKVRVVGTEVTDAGLVHMKNIPELKELILYREHFTDAGMAHLKDAKKLRKLTLTRARLNEKGVERLAAIPRLEELELSGHGFTAGRLDLLKKAPNLKVLSLRGNDFVEADAAAFAGFPKLTTLHLGIGKMSDDGLKAIRAALPGVTVER